MKMLTVHVRVYFGLIEKRELFLTLSNFVQTWDLLTCRVQHWRPHYTKHSARHTNKGQNTILKVDVFTEDNLAIFLEVP